MNHKELLLKIKLNSSSVVILIIINALLFILTSILALSLGSANALRVMGAEYLPDILNGEIWRVVLPAFLHADILHILLNMWALYHLGGAIETFYGGKKIITVYVLTGIMGSLVSITATVVQLYFNQGTGAFPLSVGSSAAVFGFVGLLIGNKFKKTAYSVSIDNYINTSQLWLFVGYNLLIGLGINFFGSSFAINNFAHIGGFVGGLFLGIFLDLVNTTYQSKTKKSIETFLFRFSLTAVILSFIAGSLSMFFNI
jgi:rhomboid protease GluP